MVFDLPPLRDLLAADHERSTMPVADVTAMRVLVQTAMFAGNVAMYMTLVDDEVVVFAIDIDQ